MVVDDNDGDILFFSRAFKQAGFKNRLITLSSGDETVKYLSGEGCYANREEFPMPKLALLDIKMPGIDGLEVLQWMRQNNSLDQIPVLMLTTSSYPEEVKRAYALGANAYLVKPMDLQEFANQVKAMGQFWLEHCRLPEVGQSAISA
jgi:CheY-like chemotaxis protein